MEAFVVNLNKRRDRWKAIQKSFQGIKLHRVAAIEKEPGAYGNLNLQSKLLIHSF